jgi:hypothetical protein
VVSPADVLEGRFPVVASGSLRGVSFSGDAVLELTAEEAALVGADGRREPLPLGTLGGVRWDAGALTLGFAAGTVVLRGEGRLAAAARDILARACAPGELTLALRTLGSHRRGADDLQRRYFEPLLAARKKLAKASDPRSQTSALDARALRASYEDFAHSLAERSGGLAPADRRALEAQLDEAIEPLLAVLRTLETSASALRTSSGEGNVAAWREWSGEATRVFAAADRCWPAVARLLAGWRPGPKPSLWRRMTGRAR